MIIDTSALLSILFAEDDAEYFARELSRKQPKFMTPFNALEADIVVGQRKGSGGQRELELLLYHSDTEVIPFTNDMRALASEAWRQYGKGRHVAGLNIGDCCAYALAVFMNDVLLFKGDDFSHTDVRRLP